MHTVALLISLFIPSFALNFRHINDFALQARYTLPDFESLMRSLVSLSEEGFVKDEELEVDCQMCVERMKKERRFDWRKQTKNKEDWEDYSFPPNEYAMYFPDPYSDHVMVDRMRETFTFWKIKADYEIPLPAKWFVDPPSAYFQQVDQLHLGDCYFLNTLAAAAYIGVPLKEEVFLTKGLDGKLHVANVYVKGVRQTVAVDTYLPVNISELVDGNVTLFSPNASFRLSFATQDSTGAVWAAVLEKMWAKTNCNYELVTGGSPVEVYEWLLGVPVHQWWLEDDFDRDPDAIWQSIVEDLDQGFIVGVGNRDDKTLNALYGLVPTHSWSVLAHSTVFNSTICPSKGCRLLLLRNPWGKDAYYRSRWRDNDTLRWTEPNIAQVSPYFGIQNDGLYWMQVEDFAKAYNGYQVGYYHPGWTHRAVEINNIELDQNYYIRIHVKGNESVEAFIYVAYYNPAMYPTSCQEAAGNTRGIMTFLSDGYLSNQTITWDSIQNQKFFYFTDLEPGEHFLKVNWFQWPDAYYREATIKGYSSSKRLQINQMNRKSKIESMESKARALVLDEGTGGLSRIYTANLTQLTVSYGFNSGYAYVQMDRNKRCNGLNVTITLDGVEGQVSSSGASKDCAQTNSTTFDCYCDLSITGNKRCAFAYEGAIIDWDISRQASC